MLVHRKESETKAALKPVCNVVFAIFGRSKAKDGNDVNDITLRLQTFGTRLGYKIYSLTIHAFLAQRVWNKSIVPNPFCAKNRLVIGNFLYSAFMRFSR